MELRIRDVGPIQAADIRLPEAGQILLLAARNEGGKTSIVRALAAVLTRTRAPLTGTLKIDGPRMVRHGAKRGHAMLASGDDAVAIHWPDCAIEEHGAALPALGRIAAGQTSFARLAPADKATVLREVYRLEITRADMEAALAAAGVRDRPAQQTPRGGMADPLYERLWSGIQKSGWDKTAENAAALARAAKLQWQDATGEAWGASKAEGWLPDGWRADLDQLSRDALNARLREAHIALDSAIANGAVMDAKRRALSERVAGLDAARAALAQAEADYEAARQRHRLAHDRLMALPMEGIGAQPCPCCGELLAVRPGGQLIKAPGAADLAAREQAASEKQAADAAADAALERKIAAGAHLREIEQAQAALAEMAKAPPARIPLEEAEAAVCAIEADLELIIARDKAAAAHCEIVDQLAIARVLGPDGVRKDRTVAVLAMVNAWLAELSEAAGLPAPVRIDPDLSVMRGDLLYEQLSESAQWRADVVLQAEIARRQGAPLIVLDRADLNDQANRNGLIGLLTAAWIAAVVAMTFSAPDVAPDLGAAGLGASLWIDGGTAIPIDRARAAEAAIAQAAE